MVAMSSGSQETASNTAPHLKENNSSTTGASSVSSSSSTTTSTSNPCTNNSPAAISATFSDTSTLSTSQAMSPTSTPVSPTTSAQGQPKELNKKNNKLPTKCPLEKCLLCTREQPLCLMRSSTWPAIMRVVFYTLKYNNPEKEFFNLKDDVYSVMLFHWNKLAIHKKSASNWKKHIQDMLSHSKDIFESGLEIYGQNGYWRLKVNTDPWTLSGKTRRSPKKALNMKRTLEDTPMAEQMPRRPFIPYIAKGNAEPGKFAENYQQPVSYVFINEHSSPPGAVPNMMRKEEIVPTPIPTSAPMMASNSPFMPNPFSQRLTFMPGFQGPPQTSPPSSFPNSPQLQALHLQGQVLSPSLQAFLSHPRLAVSLPSSRLPSPVSSPQRSRSPSPHQFTQSLPTSPRGINHPVYPSYSPVSAPASPISSPRASPYPIPKRKSVTQPPSPRSRPMSPHSRPMSPRSTPISPRNSPPSSPKMRGRVFRGIRSPPSEPQSPVTPLSPHSPVQEDSALDNLRSTFEQFHWQAGSQEAQAIAVAAAIQQQPQVHPQPPQPQPQQLQQLQQLQQPQQQQQQQQSGARENQSMEQHHIAFNLFAAAKPANPCDVSFLLNE